jgi:hypothetical protein
VRSSTSKETPCRRSAEASHRLRCLAEYGVYTGDVIVRVVGVPFRDRNVERSPNAFQRVVHLFSPGVKDGCRLMFIGSSGYSSRPAVNRCSANIRFPVISGGCTE